MKKTKIVCTIGPASENPETLYQLIKSGMNVARLNFSHGDFEEHGNRIKNIREAAKRAGKNVGILLDTKGPEIRTHDMAEKEFELVAGNEVIISMEEVTGTAEKFSLSYPGLVHDVEKGSTILIDDGLVALEVIESRPDAGEIVAKVLNTGVISSKKGVNVPGVSVNLPGMTEKDAGDILFGIEQGVDFIAASFVRRASDVLEIRALLEEHNAGHLQIIPKIENQEGVDNIDEILAVSDGLMVARGDLGVEIPTEDVPLAQKLLISKCNQAGKPVITATQMLDSMQRNPRPTRAEASDVANAILDGTDAVMLSGETAAGQYPVEAVQMMNSIALKAEQALDSKAILSAQTKSGNYNMTEAICQSVAHTALNLGTNAIITPTESGSTAKMVSKYRPNSPIIAVTANQKVLNSLSLVWGVYGQLGEQVGSTDEMLENAVQEGVGAGYIKQGDVVIITGGVPVGEKGTTNLMKIHVVGDALAKGQGLGRKSAYGRAVVVKNAEEAKAKVTPGSIMVAIGTDKDMVEALSQCSALITEEGGLTSHAAVVSIDLGIPVIVGVENATSIFEDGQEITVDATRGVVYSGHASVL